MSAPASIDPPRVVRKTSAKPKVPATPPKIAGLESLLISGNFSDFVIVCGEKEWNVHKAIICPHSEYFMKACYGQFNEAKRGRIDLSCDDQDALDVLITYLYTDSCSKQVNDKDGLADAMLPLRVHILADKYGIKPLVDMAGKYFMTLAKRYSRRAVFATLLTAALEDTPPHSIIRQQIFDHVLCNVYEMTASSEDTGSQSGSIKDALKRAPGFAVELVTKLAEAGKPAVMAEPAAEVNDTVTSMWRGRGRKFVEDRV
ncbi:hypothetical protein LTR95_005566 [Oleoguttula sp. CCFEE 5521]